MGRVSPDWTIRVGGPIEGEAQRTSADRWAVLDDAQLVRACLDGHREAFYVIVERHRRQVYQLCYRYVGTHEDAADLAQDTFVRAFKGLGGFKRQSSIATWLYRIAVNVCLNRLALKTPRPEPLLADDRPDLQQLPRKQRATLILRVYHELPHEEIAAILGSSVGATKANLFHALANLKKLLR